MRDESASDQLDSLRREVTRLRAENDELRAHFRIGPPDAPDDSGQSGERRPVRVLLLPDPLREREEGRPGPKVMANVAAIVFGAMKEKRADFEWRAEHDLNRVPEDAECFQFGHVLLRIWDGAGRIPPTYRVVRSEGSEPTIRRCLVKGEPASERFRAGHRRLVQDFDDLVAEGEAAITAGEGHHAGWVLKALELMIARMNLARTCFESDGDWQQVLDEPRPEYLLPRGIRIDATPVPRSP